MMELSPAIRETEPYAFEALDRRRAEAARSGRTLVDFGVGDPREVTPAFIRDALAAAVEPISSYPRAAGLPELRQAIAGWIDRRFGAAVDPDTRILPTLGSKEMVFSLAQTVVDRAGGRDLVLDTTPGYPVPGRGGRYAGAEVRGLPLREERRFLPDLDAVDRDTWRRTAVLWLNYPNNPTGATVPLAFLERAAGAGPRARVPAGLGRGVQRDLVRGRAARLGPPGERSVERRGRQHAQQALVDDGLPIGVRRGRPGADRRTQAAAPGGRGDPAGVRAARLDRGMERRGARRDQPRNLRRESVRCSWTCSAARRSRSRAAKPRSTCG